MTESFLNFDLRKYIPKLWYQKISVQQQPRIQKDIDAYEKQLSTYKYYEDFDRGMHTMNRWEELLQRNILLSILAAVVTARAFATFSQGIYVTKRSNRKAFCKLIVMFSAFNIVRILKDQSFQIQNHEKFKIKAKGPQTYQQLDYDYNLYQDVPKIINLSSKNMVKDFNKASDEYESRLIQERNKFIENRYKQQLKQQ